MAYNRRLNNPVYDDIQGILQTALAGVTQYTFRQVRNTGVVSPHAAQGDIFSHIIQFPHRKKLGSALKGFHIHYIPVASANGNIKFDYSWGWYNVGEVIPDVLPNSGSTADIPLTTADQYKHKIATIVADVSHPTGDTYSSTFVIKVTRVAPAGTNWGASNEIAIWYADGHFLADGNGSVQEFTD